MNIHIYRMHDACYLITVTIATTSYYIIWYIPEFQQSPRWVGIHPTRSNMYATDPLSVCVTLFLCVRTISLYMCGLSHGAAGVPKKSIGDVESLLLFKFCGSLWILLEKYGQIF